jgi:CheY-like chemotaxis protein
MTSVKGRRILIVEDEFLIAAMAEDFLVGLGATIVGPAATAAAALQLVQSQEIDAAVLDVNLNGERSDAVAAELKRRGTPFVVATGYGRGQFSELGAPVLMKPYSPEDLSAALTAALSARGSIPPAAFDSAHP